MKLKENQLNLLRHLAQFEALDYSSCLRLLDVNKTNDKTALSYAFRPLTKNKYAKKHKDGHVVILTKGRALFPDIKPLVTLGGGSAGTKRVVSISRTAMFLAEQRIGSFEHPDQTENWCFIPSTCWRNIRNGILSTTRFCGILFVGTHRLAVYDIGDGNMEWQLRAERSLFYRDHGDYKTRATGILMICDDGKRNEIAKTIIRTTMWHRKQLIGTEHSGERDRPVKYVRAPIRVAWYYEHVYLTTPELLEQSLTAISVEDEYIEGCRANHSKCYSAKDGDYEAWPYRYFINITTDLLKYVYYFAATKSHIVFRKNNYTELRYGLVLPKRDYEIVRMYHDVIEMEGAKFYEYRSAENAETD